MDSKDTRDRRRQVGVVLIDDGYLRPKSIVAAMMAAAHEAAVMVADGAVWEGDEDVLIPPAAKPHAVRMSKIWRRAADHLEGCDDRLSGGEPAPGAGAPGQSARGVRGAVRPVR